MTKSGLYMAKTQTVEGETVQCGVTFANECKTIGIWTEANELFRDFSKKNSTECQNGDWQ